MFLTRDEHRRDRSDRPSVGLRITYPNDVKHWFPGDLQIALITAESFCPAELFNHPGTTLEYGERIGPSFVLKKLIRGPRIAVVDEHSPTVISPGIPDEPDRKY